MPNKKKKRKFPRYQLISERGNPIKSMIVDKPPKDGVVVFPLYRGRSIIVTQVRFFDGKKIKIINLDLRTFLCKTTKPILTIKNE